MYRKFKADHLFTGKEILPGNWVLITNPDGTVVEIVDEKNAGDNIEAFTGIIIPGFINAHCHLELSHMKGIIPEKTGLVDFVQQVMKKRAAPSKSPPSGETLQELLEFRQTAMFEAEKELYNNGTVAVGDICNTTDTITIKQNSKIHWHNFIEVTGFVDAAAEKRMADAKNILEKFQVLNSKSQTPNSQLPTRNSLSPHAPYSVSKTLFELLNKETANQLITIHNQECEAEDELYENKSGDFLTLYENFGIDISGFQPTDKTSLQSWLPYFTNGQSILSVHNTFTSQADIDLANSVVGRRSSVIFCICPNANLYIEQKMPPIDLLAMNFLNTVIGTDSYASNHQLSILEELKTIQQYIDGMPLAIILQWATSNGAKALRIDDTFGSFEKGKRPGVVLIDNIEELQLTKASTSVRIL